MDRCALLQRLLSKRRVEEVDEGGLPGVSRTNNQNTAAVVSELIQIQRFGRSYLNGVGSFLRLSLRGPLIVLTALLA